ncbi:hypothetical protein PG999_014734, partial [Apiospora kogelbergensis]
GICAELELHLELSLAATEQSEPVDPSFDLLIYLLYKHSTERLSHLKSQEYGAHVPIGTASHMKLVNCNDFVQFALGLRQSSMSTSNLISTPQEYPRIAVLSCVRYCIGWCAKSIDIDESLLRRQLDVTWLARGMTQIHSSRWPQFMALYNALHRKWRSDESGRKPEVSNYYNDELLDPDDDFDSLQYSMRSRLLRKIDAVQSLADEVLVTEFLQRMYLRTADRNVKPFQPTKQGWLGSGVDAKEPVLSIGQDYSVQPLMSDNLLRMRNAATFLFRKRPSSKGSKLSRDSRERIYSLAESIESVSGMMRDSLSISKAPLQEY